MTQWSTQPKIRDRAGPIALVAIGAAVFGALAFGGPASADVTVAPAGGTQGEAGRLTFSIPNDRPGAHTVKVELQIPDATPVGEVFPMSVDNWAPGLTYRKLDAPVELIHGSPTTEVVTQVTWTRAAGTPLPAPGQVDELSISLGPLPMSPRLAFTVLQTYSDGVVARWGDTPGPDGAQPNGPGPALTLVPPVTQPEDAAPLPDAADDEGGMSALGVGTATVLVAAALLLAAWFFLRPGRGKPVTATTNTVGPSPAGRGRPGGGRPGIARRVRRIHRLNSPGENRSRSRERSENVDYSSGSGLGGRPKDRADA